MKMTPFFQWFESRIDPYPEETHQIPNRGVLRFALDSLNGVRRWLLLLFIVATGIGILEALMFQWMSYLVDWIGQYTPATLWGAKGGMLALMGIGLLLRPLVTLVASTLRFQSLQGVLPMRLRWRFHRLMLNQSLSFYQDEFAGRVSAKVMQTALAIRDVIMTFTDETAYLVVYFLSSSLILWGFDAWLLLPFLTWVVLFILMLWWFVPRLRQQGEAQANARSMMTGRITDAYSNIATVKLFSHSERESAYARTAMDEFMDTVHKQMRWVTLLEFTSLTLNTLLIGSVAALGLLLWNAGKVSPGAMVAAIAMAMRINELSHWIMWQASSLTENIGTIQDGMNTLTKPQLVLDRPDATQLTIQQGDIRFENVDFFYNENKKNDTRPVLKNFCLHIRPGEKIGLVGRSGAGKSTIVNLLLRFYDVQQGRIVIDGQNIADVTQNSLRAQIGMVTQDTSLLHRSVRDNILYGRPDATDAEMREAARKAEADVFIESLEDPSGNKGFDVQVGERGVKLSGGQRQRIAIARVILKNAPILLLDEATSALDSEVEAAIQDSLNTLMAGKTVIAIAHRLSTIAAMDRLVVLDKGTIVEEGSHAELLARNGLYARLWAHQSGGFLGEQTASDD